MESSEISVADRKSHQEEERSQMTAVATASSPSVQSVIHEPIDKINSHSSPTDAHATQTAKNADGHGHGHGRSNGSDSIGNIKESMSDNDCSPSLEKKKPLHLQIIEDGTTCSSSSACSSENIRLLSQMNHRTGGGEVDDHDHDGQDALITNGKGRSVTSVPDDILREMEGSNNHDGILLESAKGIRLGQDKISPSSSSETETSNGSKSDNNNSSIKDLDNQPQPQQMKKGIDNERKSSTPDLASMNQSLSNNSHSGGKPNDDNQNNPNTGESELNATVPATANIKTKANDSDSNGTNQSLSQDVASALDKVLADLDSDDAKGEKKDRPCMLQQSLVGDSATSSSGTSTPSSESLRVESSMLIPEDSLQFIAQMTIDGKKLKGGTLNNVSVQNSESKPDINKDTNCALNTRKFLDGIRIRTSIPLPANGINPNLNESPRNAKKVPLIFGTAAAQLHHVINRNSPRNGSNPNSPSQNNTNSYSLQSTPPPKALGLGAGNNNLENEQEENQDKAMGWEKGMGMLADIISTASPMQPKSNSKGRNGIKNSTMVPVGQSLRLYSSIAAQAGVSSYTPTLDVDVSLKSSSVPLKQEIQNQNEEMNGNDNRHVFNDQQVPSVTPADPTPRSFVREIGKIRRYNASTNSFGNWEDLPFQTYGDSEPRRWCDLNIDESIEIPLRRGGRLRVFPNFLGETRRCVMKNTMENCALFRQYNCFRDNKVYAEQRLQVLLSSQATLQNSKNNQVQGVGFLYNGVSMKAKPISREPQVEKLAGDLAELYRLPNKQWSIGANLVHYRNGNDNTSWHSDDTQDEALILCIVVDSVNHARPVLVKPKAEGGFQQGDEEIIIFVGQGDAYEMDGQMQLNYEHCVPTKNEDMNARRSAIIFRQGLTMPVTIDTGTPLVKDPLEMEMHVESTSTQTQPKSHANFGRADDIREGKKLYTKDLLIKSGAHRSAKKLICGSMREGCESMLVESLDRTLREDDGLCWLQITCEKLAGGGALCQSYHMKGCVRVFRSSELDNKYSPALYQGEDHNEMYRYDGLYTVRAMWDVDGVETETPPETNEKYTFLLMRQPKRPADSNPEDAIYYNRISLQELWNEIEKRRGARKTKKFAVPEPIMNIGRIGDKNRRRPAASTRRVLNDDSNSKAIVKKKNVNVIQFSNYESVLENKSSCMYSSSDSDSDCDSDEESEKIEEEKQIPVTESLNENGRPKRRSAAVARHFLNEVMHNRYGDVGKKASPQTPSRKRSLWSTSSPAEKVEDTNCKRNGQSSDDELEKELMQVSEKDPESDVEEVNIEQKKEEEKETNSIKSNHSKEVEEAETYVEKEVPKSAPVPSKRQQNNKRRKKVKAEAVMKKVEDELSISSDDKTKKEKVDPEQIRVGSRVNVEYRNTLFKATVRRIRNADDVYEFSIHYDGNKKSNVHWIQLSMVHDVLDEKPVQIKGAGSVIKPSTITAPKRGRKRKLSPNQKEVSQPQAIKDETAEEKKPKEILKFPIGSDVYVDHKRVLYLSTILRSRKNRKGNVEYFVHYDGFKKTSDRWMKEAALFDISKSTTARFNEERGVDATEEVTKIESALVKEEILEKTLTPHAAKSSTSVSISKGTRSGKAHIDEPKQSNSDAIELDMSDFDSGVEFLPGSCVFVARTNALYLAKMKKRRKRGRGTDYLVEFEGMSSEHDEWTSLSNIYELNPKTRKIYERTSDLREIPVGEESSSSEDEELKEAEKQKPKPIPIVPKKIAATRGRRRGSTTRQKKPITSRLYDMNNIEAGMEFLPGSTLFVQWRNGLYLGKMLKKRGKGEHMEYLIHYDGFNSTHDEWVSVSMVFEINPQTKRAFNKQKKKS